MKNTGFRRINLIILVIFVQLFQAGVAMAQQNDVSTCLDTIKNHLKTKEVRFDNAEKLSFAYSWLSSQEYLENNTSKGALMEAVWKTIPIKGSYNQTNFKTFKDNFSKESMVIDTESRELYVFREMLGKDAARLLEICMQGRSLTLNGNLKKNGDQFTLEITFKSAQGNSIGNLEFTNLSNLRAVKPLQDLVPAVPREVSLIKNDSNQWSTATIGGKDSLGTLHQIVVEVPPVGTVDWDFVQLYKIYYFSDPVRLTNNSKTQYCTWEWYNSLTPTYFDIGRKAVYYRFDSTASFDRRCSCPGCPADEHWNESCMASFTARLEIDDVGDGMKILRQVDPIAQIPCNHGLPDKLAEHFKTFDRAVLNRHK